MASLKRELRLYGLSHKALEKLAPFLLRGRASFQRSGFYLVLCGYACGLWRQDR
jgi:hypothetical protein